MRGLFLGQWKQNKWKQNFLMSNNPDKNLNEGVIKLFRNWSKQEISAAFDRISLVRD